MSWESFFLGRQRLILGLAAGLFIATLSKTAFAQTPLPEPLLLPPATTSQIPLTAVFNALNVPSLAAGGHYLDPTTQVKVYKVTSASFPAASANWGHDYADGGNEVSLPYDEDTRAMLVRQNGGSWWLLDFTPGAGVGNPRQLTGNLAPFMDLAFTFSNNPATPYYAYVSRGSTIRRFDIRTMSEAPGDGWPVTGETSAMWLHQSENDAFFVWMRGASGTTVVGYEPSSGVLKTYTNAGLNEPRIDRAGRYVGVSMSTPRNGLVVWDWQTDSVSWSTSGDPGIPFAHNASLKRRWMGVDWNMSYPPDFTKFNSNVPNSVQRIGGPANGTLIHGSGNWIQNPADLDDQWAVFLHYGSLRPPESYWLAPGGMVLVTPNRQGRLLAHAYNTTGNYTFYSFAKFAPDGRYVMFTSNMNGAGRSDVFLAELPRGASGSDTTPPSVSFIAPPAGSILTGTAVAVSASASDNVGVAGVQFKLDGVNLGAEDTTAPYSFLWDTTRSPNGSHTLTALARDAAGNTASSSVTVSVNNLDITPPVLSAVAASGISASGATISWTTDEGSDSQVEYGTTTAYGSTTPLNGTMLTAHSQALSGLTAATLHHYRVKSRDAAGNLAVSTDFNFTTSGAAPPPASAEPVQWTSLVNVTATGNSLQKTGGCDGCQDAGAASQQQISAGDGYLEFTASETNSIRCIGLSTGNPGTSGGEIKFAIRLQAGIAEVRESGAYKADTPFVPGDLLRVALEGGVVKYYKNVVRFYTSAGAPSYPLLVDTALYSLNSSVSNAVIWRASGSAPPPDTTPPAVSLTAPAPSSSVSGSISVVASATDDVGVAGVQFKLDGVNLGAEDISNPYSFLWDTSLSPNGSHTLSAVARDAAGNTATSSVTVNVTNDLTPPVLTSVAASGVSASRATISWTTDEASDSQVEYGTMTAYGSATALDAALLTSHTQTLSGLAEATVYHYRVRSRDAAGHLAVSADFSFTTLDATAPAVSLTSPLAAQGVSGSITVSASASDNVGVVGVQFKLDGVNLGAEDTSNPYSFLWDTSLSPNGAHTLSAVARDAAGNTASSSVTVSVANDLAPPVLSAVVASGIAASAATISWTSDEASDSQVEYGTTTAYGSSTALDATMVTSHTQTLAGLAEATVYHYRVRSRDAAGNLAFSADFSFTTLGLDAGLIAHLKLDEGAGAVAADASSNGNAGSLLNGAAWSVGANGQAVAMDGINDYVSVPHAASLDAYPLSVAVWFKTTTAAGVRGLVNKYGANSYNGYQLFFKNGTLCAWYLRDDSNYVYEGGGCTLGTTGYNDGRWHHAVFVVDAQGGRLYLDGVQTRTRPWTGVPGPVTTAQDLRLGHYPGAFGGAEYLPGTIDELRIYNRALSAGEIAHLFSLATLDTTPPAVSLTAPAPNSTESGIVSVAASATDDVGVVGVQFMLDGVNLGAEDTSNPYEVSWDTSLSPTGAHILSAVARDAAGNTATSSVTANVANDLTPPVLSAVVASGVSASGATISWTTDEAGDSQVEYGATTAYGSSTALDAALLTAHSQTLSGLAEASVYHYRVRSRDAAGNLAVSADFTSTTLDAAAPSVSLTSPLAGQGVSGSITVSASASDNVGVVGVQFKLHGVNLGAEDTGNPYEVTWDTSLSPNGSHTLSAVARDAAGNTATTAAVILTVSNDPAPPLLSGVTASNISSSSATITWTTDEPSDTQVEYGTTTAYGFTTALNAAMLTSHSRMLSGLAPRTDYHYRVKSRDAAGNLAVSANFTFRTKRRDDDDDNG